MPPTPLDEPSCNRPWRAAPWRAGPRPRGRCSDARAHGNVRAAQCRFGLRSGFATRQVPVGAFDMSCPGRIGQIGERMRVRNGREIPLDRRHRFGLAAEASFQKFLNDDWSGWQRHVMPLGAEASKHAPVRAPGTHGVLRGGESVGIPLQQRRIRFEEPLDFCRRIAGERGQQLCAGARPERKRWS